MTVLEELMMWGELIVIAAFFIVLFGTFYIAIKDLINEYIKTKKGGKHGRK